MQTERAGRNSLPQWGRRSGSAMLPPEALAIGAPANGRQEGHDRSPLVAGTDDAGWPDNHDVARLTTMDARTTLLAIVATAQAIAAYLAITRPNWTSGPLPRPRTGQPGLPGQSHLRSSPRGSGSSRLRPHNFTWGPWTFPRLRL